MKYNKINFPYFKLSLFFLLISLSSSSIVYSQGDSLIYWSSKYQLKWSDFKTIDIDTIDLSTHKYHLGAVSCLGSDFIDTSEGNIPDINYFHYFNRNHSWVTKNEMTKDLLNHEQLHFDINELFARKIRKRLEELKNLRVQDLNKYYSAIESFRKQRIIWQEKYDLETGTGSYKDYQIKWNFKIALGLSELRKYEIDTPAHADVRQ